MLLAYRRGLLKPDYPNGLQSRIREKMMLDMLDMELSSDLMLDKVNLTNNVYSSHFDSKKLGDVIDHAYDNLTVAHKLREYDINYSSRKINSINSEKVTMAEAFTALKERGIIKSFRQHVDNVLRKLNI